MNEIVEKRKIPSVRLPEGVMTVEELEGGWMMLRIGRGLNKPAYFEVVNEKDGVLIFYKVTNVETLYHAPKTVQEPFYAIACSKFGLAVDSTVVGALVIDDLGEIKERASWSNLIKMQGKTVEAMEDGQLLIDGVSKGYLLAIFLPDKNRMEGYVGVFGPEKPEQVKVLEMEDLLLQRVFPQ